MIGALLLGLVAGLIRTSDRFERRVRGHARTGIVTRIDRLGPGRRTRWLAHLHRRSGHRRHRRVRLGRHLQRPHRRRDSAAWRRLPWRVASVAMRGRRPRPDRLRVVRSADAALLVSVRTATGRRTERPGQTIDVRPSRLPETGKSVGKGLRELRAAHTEREGDSAMVADDLGRPDARGTMADMDSPVSEGVTSADREQDERPEPLG